MMRTMRRSIFRAAVLTGCAAIGAWSLTSSRALGAEPEKAAETKWESLFDGKSLGGWKSSEFGGAGEIEVEDGKLVIGYTDGCNGVTWTKDFPKTDYEISLEAMRVDGTDFFCGLTFPVGSSPCSLIVGGWGGSVVGLSSLDGQDAAHNETTRSMTFKQGVWYRIRLRVTSERIQAWIDDKPLVDVATKDRKISIRLEVERSKPLGIASWCTTAALREIKFRRLPGEAKPAASDGGALPDAVPDDVAMFHDLRYREGAVKHCTLDLAVPRGDVGPPRPAIVVIHGGGWIEGDKSSFSTPEHRPPGNIIDFARLGFVAATINYRLADEAPFPAALDDCKCAVRWLRAHAAEYRIDPQRIGAWGNSAGGHLALLLGMVDEKAGAEVDGPFPEQSSRVQAVVSDSGPVDLAYQHDRGPLRSVVERFLGGPPEGSKAAEYRLASPISHVSPQSPPLMLIYGEADGQVPVETADRFVESLDKAGVRDVSYLRLGNVDHCPHSLIRVAWLTPAVNDFFLRTLRHQPER
jgi:acetyl esterase/lipase